MTYERRPQSRKKSGTLEDRRIAADYALTGRQRAICVHRLGVKVVLVEVKQVDLAEQMIRAIARQAEAERKRRAQVIHAEGEYTAAEKFSMAAEVLQHQPA
jgi:regulator of protease activity HflC (stomatin/prohibitin superfamily)